MKVKLDFAARNLLATAIPAAVLLCMLVWVGRSSLAPFPSIGQFASTPLYDTFVTVGMAWLCVTGILSFHKKPAVAALDAALSSVTLVQVTKVVSGLPRPSGHPDGYPSGHTTFSFAMAGLLSAFYPRLRTLWYSIAILVGWSRVEVLAHYPYQVIVGAFLGTCIAALAVGRREGFLFSALLRRLPMLQAHLSN